MHLWEEAGKDDRRHLVLANSDSRWKGGRASNACKTETEHPGARMEDVSLI